MNIIKIVQVVAELNELKNAISSTEPSRRRWWVRPSNQNRETEGKYFFTHCFI